MRGGMIVLQNFDVLVETVLCKGCNGLEEDIGVVATPPQCKRWCGRYRRAVCDAERVYYIKKRAKDHQRFMAKKP